MPTMCEFKTNMNNLIQEYYDEYNRMNESRIQQKIENDSELKLLTNIIKDNEIGDRLNLNRIHELEKELSTKKKVIHEYEEMIRNLEDKINEIQIEKEETNRFDMVRIQADDILRKEKEIERLEKLLQNQQSFESIGLKL